MTISRELADLLRAGRRDFNARMTEACHRYPALNGEYFNHFLAHCVDPLVVAAPAERRGRLLGAGYDVGLELVGRELCGAHVRGELLDTLWRDVLPGLVTQLPANAAPVLSALCNALLNLHAQGARAEQWLQLLREQGPTLAHTALTDLGVLAAWRAGAAQFRTAALRIAEAQPDAARAILGLPAGQDMNALLQQLTQEPWLLAPAHAGIAQREMGAFTGFGGPFSRPPELRACADGFLVQSGDRYFLLLADCFGEVLLPASEEEYRAAAHYEAAIESRPSLDNGRLTGPRGQVDIELCPDGLQLVWNAHSAALFSPYSFAICVVPWR